MVLLGSTSAAAEGPCFFLDFDDDGSVDAEYVTRVDLEPFESDFLYVGIECPGTEFGTAEYQIIYEGDARPSVSVFGEKWAGTAGDLLDGGWLQFGVCRPNTRTFIAVIAVVGTGKPQYFEIARTSEPFREPNYLRIFDCEIGDGKVPGSHAGGVSNSAACNAEPRPVDPDLLCECGPESDLPVDLDPMKHLEHGRGHDHGHGEDEGQGHDHDHGKDQGHGHDHGHDDDQGHGYDDDAGDQADQ
jgi:hypothetical protein